MPDTQLVFKEGVGGCRGRSVFIENLTRSDTIGVYEVRYDGNTWIRKDVRLTPRELQSIGCTKLNPIGTAEYRIID